MRRTNQDQSHSPVANNATTNHDLLDDLRVSGVKKARATFGSPNKVISTLDIQTHSKHRLEGQSGSPRSNTVNKWNKTGSVKPSTISPRGVQPGNKKDEDINTQLSAHSEKRLHAEIEHDSARHGSQSTTSNYAKILKLGDITSTKNGKKKGIKGGNSNPVVVQSPKNSKFGLTEMQSPPNISSNMDLPTHTPGTGLNNLGKSQTTFRRTPLRVRVEDLMTVNET